MDILKQATIYKKGSIIPVWVYKLSPRKYRHKLTFGADMAIFRLGGYHILFPVKEMAEDEHMIFIKNIKHADIICNPYGDKHSILCFDIDVAKKEIQKIMNNKDVDGPYTVTFK